MQSHYKHFAVELFIEGIIMFFVMYAMVATAQHIYFNNNNLYMTLMMIAPMGLVMLISMRHMYQNKKLNLILYTLFIIVFLASFYAIRTQAVVGNKQFLLSMIPHHSGAILMCGKASISDPEILSLCKEITESQTREINQMQEILKRY